MFVLGDLAYRYFLLTCIVCIFLQPKSMLKSWQILLKNQVSASIQQLEDLIPVSHSNRQNKSEYNGVSSSKCHVLSSVSVFHHSLFSPYRLNASLISIVDFLLVWVYISVLHQHLLSNTERIKIKASTGFNTYKKSTFLSNADYLFGFNMLTKRIPVERI